MFKISSKETRKEKNWIDSIITIGLKVIKYFVAYNKCFFIAFHF